MPFLDLFCAYKANLRSKVTNIVAKIRVVRSKVKSRSVGGLLNLLVFYGLKLYPGVFLGAEIDSAIKNDPKDDFLEFNLIARDICSHCCMQPCKL